MRALFVLLPLVLAACNPRPVACDAERGLVDKTDKAASVERCRLDQVCCKWDSGRFGCGEVRAVGCTPQAPDRAR